MPTSWKWISSTGRPWAWAFRLGDELVHRFGVLAHRLGDVQVGEDVADVPHTRVVVMAVAVLMPMAVLMVVGMLVVMPVDMVVGVAGMGLVLGRLVDMAVEGHVVAFLLSPPTVTDTWVPVMAALHSGLGGEHHPRQAQAVHALHKALGVGGELQQGGGEHIPGGAHVAFQVQCFHSDAPFRD